MFRTTLFLLQLLLAIYSVMTYKYQNVPKCPKISGDPRFKIDEAQKKSLEIVATTSAADAKTDRCVYIKGNFFYITGSDHTVTTMKFNNYRSTGPGTFTEIGPDGQTYNVIVLQSYGKCCGNMYLVLRCSNSAGVKDAPPTFKIHADTGSYVSEICLKNATATVKAALGHDVEFTRLDNTQCYTAKDVCSIQ